MITFPQQITPGDHSKLSKYFTNEFVIKKISYFTNLILFFDFSDELRYETGGKEEDFTVQLLMICYIHIVKYLV